MRLINNNYICPSCKGHLRVGSYLVFATKTKNKHKGILLMSPVVGNYEYQHHEKFVLNEGERVNFYCPICQSDLTSAVHKDYAMVHMVAEEDGAEYELYFSKLNGNKSTYLVANDIVESFGVDDLDLEDFLQV